MDTKTNPNNTPAHQTTEKQQKRDSGLDLIPTLLFLLMTNWNTPTWSTPICEILADTKNKLEKTAQTVAETQRTATAGLTIGIIGTATAAAAIITAILTACLT